mmetsp:Transcript_65450/g.171459  ORF Transcript_65450/g.171459 Transcript_65450/m.171459 type:complete len:305 (+) Transcript_65450:107-1021(+)
MNAAILASGNNDLWESLKGPLKGIATFVIAALGTVFSGMLGSVIYPTPPGIGAIAGCVLGCLIFTAVGCVATGFFMELVSEKIQPGRLNIKNVIPHWASVTLGGHGQFELVLTVHKVEGVTVMNKLPWQGLHMFVEIECGQNPVKCTRVMPSGKFSQQFKLKIQPTDEHIILRLKDQDVFGSTNIGYVVVDVLKDIIQTDFQKCKDFDLEAGDSYALKHVDGVKAALWLSFDYTDAYPNMVRPEKRFEEVEHEKLRFHSLNEAEQGDYGSVKHKPEASVYGSFMQKMPVFNPGTRPIEFDEGKY